MKSKHGKQWRALAYEYQQLADMRLAALQRVWLLTETIEDPALQHDIRAAMMADFVPLEYIIQNGEAEEDTSET